MSHFTVIKNLSEGSYGITRLVKYGDNIIVEKKSKGKFSLQNGIENAGILELGILRNLSNPSIIDIVPPFFKINPDNTYSLYLEAMDGDLDSFLKNNIIYQYLPPLENYIIKKSNGTYYIKDTVTNTSIHNLPVVYYPHFPVDIFKSIIYQLISGINYLNCNAIMHSDLKPQNILYKIHGSNNKISVKITDFGLSQQLLLPRNNLRCICTEHFKAPECYLIKKSNTFEYKYPVSLKADIYSLGAIMYGMVQSFKLGKYSYHRDYLLRIPVSDDWNDISDTFAVNKESILRADYQTYTQRLDTNNQKLKILITSWKSFEQQHGKTDLEKIYPFSAFEMNNLKDLLINTLEFNPHRRISSFGLSDHVFFQNSEKHQGGASLAADVSSSKMGGINNKFKTLTLNQYNSKYLDTLYLGCIYNHYIERYYNSSLFHNPIAKNLQEYVNSTNSNVANINTKMFDILFIWLFEVIDSWRRKHINMLIPDNVFYLCIHLFRCYILQSKKPVLRKNLQGYGLIALYISMKYYVFVYSSVDYSHLREVCDNAYTKTQFLQFEKDFLNTLNGNFEVLPYHFFSYYYFLKFNFNDIDNSKFITAQEQFDKNLYHKCVMILNFLVLDSYIAIRYPTDYVGFISVFLAIVINIPHSYGLHGELFMAYLEDIKNVNSSTIPKTFASVEEVITSVEHIISEFKQNIRKPQFEVIQTKSNLGRKYWYDILKFDFTSILEKLNTRLEYFQFTEGEIKAVPFSKSEEVVTETAPEASPAASAEVVLPEKVEQEVSQLSTPQILLGW